MPQKYTSLLFLSWTQYIITKFLECMHIYIYIYTHTGLFVRPSGISDPCGTVAGMVTPKGSMSTEGERLQVSVLPYRCSIC